MEVLSTVVESVVTEVFTCLCGSLCTGIGYSCKLRSNLNKLEKEMKALIDQRNDIQQKMESAADHEDRNPPPRTTDRAQDWIRKVEELELKVNSVIASTTTQPNKITKGCFCSCSRCRFSWKVAELLDQALTLQKEGSSAKLLQNMCGQGHQLS